MKRVLYILSLAAAAILLSQCAFREQDAPETSEGAPFELFAKSSDTKTVNDGLSTKWELGDKISVFHCVHGGKTPVFDGVFEIDDADKGHAVGTVRELSSGDYDWFLFYPGSQEGSSDPGGDVVIEAQASQDGYGSRAHLAGPGFPLGGKAEKVSYMATPSVTLHPLLSVIEVHLTNSQDVPAKVKAVSFTAPEAVAGKFQASWNGVFSAKGDNSETVSLSVGGATLLDRGGEANLYLGLKPFQAAAGSQLKLSVTMVTEDGREAEQEKIVTLSAATAFKSGIIKTLNFSFDEAFPAPKDYVFKKVSTVKSGHHYLLVAEYNGVYYAGQYFDASVSSGRMTVREVTPVGDEITIQNTDGAFRFVSTEGGWLITQADGRYIYNNNADNIGVSSEPADAGKCWGVEFDTGGVALITNRTRQLKFNTTSSVMKFQSRLKTASGLAPLLYELENDELYNEEFMSMTTPGVYSVNGENWLYNEGTDQLSVYKYSTTTSFRILTPATYTAVQVEANASFVEGDYCSLNLKRFVKLTQTHSMTLYAKVLQLSDGKVWLLTDDGIGVIAKID